MPYITATQETFIKLSKGMSGQLAPDEKVAVIVGKQLAVTECQQDGNHSQITFSGKLTIGGKPIKTAWIYTPTDPKLKHWDGLDVFKQAAIQTSNYYSSKGSGDFIIPVPYQSQIGNNESLFGPDWRQCMLTSVSEAIRVIVGEAAVAKALQVSGTNEWENVYGEILNRFGDTTNPDAHIQALKFMGIDAVMRYDGTPEIIRTILQRGVPVPSGWKWSSDGHWRVFVGFGDDGSFIIDDPYGQFDLEACRRGEEAYITIGSGGKHNRYTAQDIKNNWNDLGPDKGWFVEIKNPPFAKSVVQTKPASANTGLISQAVKVMANPNLPEPEIKQLIEVCCEWLPRYGITNNRNRLIHFFAQSAHETGGYWWLDERGDDAYFEREYGIAVRDDLGNEVMGDGATYHGRGMGMVTGKYNYQVVTDKTGIDYVTYPDKMTEYPGALVSFLIWWEANQMNELCDRGLDDTDVMAVGARINGKNPPINANDRLNRSDRLKLLIV